MRTPNPAARTMALLGLTGISENSRTVQLGGADHITPIRGMHRLPMP
jgi:hypothetical protein